MRPRGESFSSPSARVRGAGLEAEAAVHAGIEPRQRRRRAAVRAGRGHASSPRMPGFRMPRGSNASRARRESASPTARREQRVRPARGGHALGDAARADAGERVEHDGRLLRARAGEDAAARCRARATAWAKAPDTEAVARARRAPELGRARRRAREADHRGARRLALAQRAPDAVGDPRHRRERAQRGDAARARSPRSRRAAR